MSQGEWKWYRRLNTEGSPLQLALSKGRVYSISANLDPGTGVRILAVDGTVVSQIANDSSGPRSHSEKLDDVEGVHAIDFGAWTPWPANLPRNVSDVQVFQNGELIFELPEG